MKLNKILFLQILKFKNLFQSQVLQISYTAFIKLDERALTSARKCQECERAIFGACERCFQRSLCSHEEHFQAP
jgi:hypothetical protein